MDSETTRDAMRTVANCLVDIAGLPRDHATQHGTGYHAAKLSLLLRKAAHQLCVDSPMMPEVRDGWALQLDQIHHDGEQAVLTLFNNALVMGLKLYQHPEIAISFHNVDEDTHAGNEEDHSG